MQRPHPDEAQHHHADTDREHHEGSLATHQRRDDNRQEHHGNHLRPGAGVSARQQDLVGGEVHDSMMALSGWNADQANQNVSTWGTASSDEPANGPSIA